MVFCPYMQSSHYDLNYRKSVREKKPLTGSGSVRFLVVIGLLILCILLIISVIGMYRKHAKVVRARDTYLAELRKLQEKEQQVTQSIERLSTDTGIEDEIRERYRVTKPGEKLILVIDNTPKPADTVEPKTFWGKIWAVLVFWK